jgi:hypothetical protein
MRKGESVFAAKPVPDNQKDRALVLADRDAAKQIETN